MISTHHTIGGITTFTQSRTRKTELIEVREIRVVQSGDGWVKAPNWTVSALVLV